MNVILFSLLSMVILIPIIYFIPLRITTKGKMIIVAASFAISLICGLLTKIFLSLWQSILLIIALALLLTLILSKRFSSVFVNKSEATMIKEDVEDEIAIKDTQLLHSEEKSELSFLGEQEAKDLHDHSIQDKGLDQDAFLFDDYEKSLEFDLELQDSFNREESPLYDIKSYDSKNEEKDLLHDIEQTADKAIFTNDALNNENSSIQKDELLAVENEWLDNLDVMEPFDTNNKEKDLLHDIEQTADKAIFTDDVMNNENFSIQKDELSQVENGWLDNLDVMVVDEAEFSSSIETNLESVQDDNELSNKSTSYLSELEKVMLYENLPKEDSKDNAETIVNQDTLLNVDEIEMLLENHPQLEANEQVAVLLETPEDLVGQSSFKTLENIEEPTALESLENIEESSVLENLEDIMEPSVTENTDGTGEVSVLENEEDTIDESMLEEEVNDDVSEQSESPIVLTEKQDKHPIHLVEQEDTEANLQEIVVNAEAETTPIAEVPEILPIDDENDNVTDMITDDDNVLGQTEEQIRLNEQQKQVFQTMLVQADISKKTLNPDQYEQMLISFLGNKLPASEQYTLSLLLVEHYIKIKNEPLLLQLLEQMEDEFSHFPILLQEIHYLQEQYVEK